MYIVDTALAARAASGEPVQVAMFGAGYMARGITTQIVRYTPGLRLAVICNRTVEKAIGCYTAVGVDPADIREVTSAAALDQAIRDGKFAVTNDPAVPASAAARPGARAAPPSIRAAPSGTAAPDASGTTVAPIGSSAARRSMKPCPNASE